jgi:hypothetical protein
VVSAQESLFAAVEVGAPVRRPLTLSACLGGHLAAHLFVPPGDPAAVIAARISESSTARYRSVVAIDACPSADIPPNAAG